MICRGWPIVATLVLVPVVFRGSAQLGPGTVGEAMATGYLGRALGLQPGADGEACRLLCAGYRELKANPQASPAVIKQFAAWIEEQDCDCDPACG